jgi:anti-sigma-K factor RskA
MSSAQHIPPDDLTLFALQFLPEAEMQAARQHIQECEACRRQVGWIQGDLASYALSAEAHDAPAHARERLLAAVAREKKVVPMQQQTSRTAAATPPTPSLVSPIRSDSDPYFDAPEPRLFAMSHADESRRTGFWGFAGWATAAALAVAAGLQYRQHIGLQQQLADANAKITTAQTESARAEAAMQALTASGATQVAMHLPASAGSVAAVQPYGQAVYTADTGALVFVASHLDPLAPHKTYELWLLPADKSAPIPAGIFKPDAHGNASVVMPELPKGVAAGGFGVTVEADGGSPVPTSAIVLSGA